MTVRSVGLVAIVASLMAGAGHCAAAADGPHREPGRPSVASSAGEAATPYIPSPAPPSTRPLVPATGRPAASRSFELVVKTPAGAVITEGVVDPFTAVARPDGTAEPIDPPQWGRSVWLRQFSFPGRPPAGTSYIYGHACHHHQCPFTTLKATRPGDTIVATTSNQVLTYRVTRIGTASKTAAALPTWAVDSAVPGRLVLVTCRYDDGDTSTNDIVVLGKRIGSHDR